MDKTTRVIAVRCLLVAVVLSVLGLGVLALWEFEECHIDMDIHSGRIRVKRSFLELGEFGSSGGVRAGSSGDAIRGSSGGGVRGTP